MDFNRREFLKMVALTTASPALHHAKILSAAAEATNAPVSASFAVGIYRPLIDEFNHSEKIAKMIASWGSPATKKMRRFGIMQRYLKQMHGLRLLECYLEQGGDPLAAIEETIAKFDAREKTARLAAASRPFPISTPYIEVVDKQTVREEFGKLRTAADVKALIQKSTLKTAEMLATYESSDFPVIPFTPSDLMLTCAPQNAVLDSSKADPVHRFTLSEFIATDRIEGKSIQRRLTAEDLHLVSGVDIFLKSGLWPGGQEWEKPAAAFLNRLPEYVRGYIHHYPADIWQHDFSFSLGRNVEIISPRPDAWFEFFLGPRGAAPAPITADGVKAVAGAPTSLYTSVHAFPLSHLFGQPVTSTEDLIGLFPVHDLTREELHAAMQNKCRPSRKNGHLPDTAMLDALKLAAKLTSPANPAAPTLPEPEISVALKTEKRLELPAPTEIPMPIHPSEHTAKEPVPVEVKRSDLA